MLLGADGLAPRPGPTAPVRHAPAHRRDRLRAQPGAARGGGHRRSSALAADDRGGRHPPGRGVPGDDRGYRIGPAARRCSASRWSSPSRCTAWSPGNPDRRRGHRAGGGGLRAPRPVARARAGTCGGRPAGRAVGCGPTPTTRSAPRCAARADHLRALAADPTRLVAAVGWGAANWLLDAAALRCWSWPRRGTPIDPLKLFAAYAVAGVLGALP